MRRHRSRSVHKEKSDEDDDAPDHDESTTSHHHLTATPNRSSTVVVVKKIRVASRGERGDRSANFLGRLFLPDAYFQGRLSSDYLTFQLFDTIQALTSYLRGALCTQALLKGLGVGSATASSTSSTLTWIIRDGIGMVSSLLFAALNSKAFGKRVKFWRLFADVSNDVGLTLELMAPRLGPGYFLPAVCLANVMKAMCGVAAGATRAVITAHFASQNLSGDLADVQAKEGSQETFVTLLGICLGYFITSAFASGDDDALFDAFAPLAFAFLTLVHVVCNYVAVKSLIFRTLDEERFCIVMEYWMATGRVLDPVEVARRERIVSFTSSLLRDTVTFGFVDREDDEKTLQYRRLRLGGDNERGGVALLVVGKPQARRTVLVDREASVEEIFSLVAALLLQKIRERRKQKATEADDEHMMSEGVKLSRTLIKDLLKLGWDLEASRGLIGDEEDYRLEL